MREHTATTRYCSFYFSQILALQHFFFFQIPFPAVTYCPELNKRLLEQLVECRLEARCDNLTSSQISTNVNALKAGCFVCNGMYLIQESIEKKIRRELLLSDFRNNTYNDYLRTFLDPSWIERQSFCMSGLEKLELVETLALDGNLCYTINGLKGVFKEKK